MTRPPEEEIKRLRKKLKKCKKKRREHLKQLIECQRIRSGHWDKLVYEKKKNEALQQKLSSLPYATLRYTLAPFSFLKNIKKRKSRITGVTNKSSTKQPYKIKPIREINVALICDEFSYNSFKYEFNPINVEPHDWKQSFERTPPDLFFCESAWSGIDSKLRPWKGKIYSSTNFTKENRKELLEILDYCNQNKIPTVFWNKEDPTHFDDEIHNFIKTAILFDYIFTSDENCIDRYKNEFGHEKVFCLPFATQPKLFNPVEQSSRKESIVFAGSWYKNHKKRCKDMTAIFDSILKNGREIEIYDRYFGEADKKHIFPEKYRKFTKPPVDHDQIHSIYKSSIFGLNINTVQQSSTMFARRIYELMSSNTYIISNYSEGVEKLLNKHVLFAEKEPDKLASLSGKEIDDSREHNLHLSLEKHTYYERFKLILDTIKLPYIPADDSITIVCFANKPEEIQKIESFYRNQQVDNKQLLIVLSEEIPEIESSALYSKYNRPGTAIISLHYIKTYAQSWNKIITTRFFVIMDHTQKYRSDLIHRARLHTSYINDPILIRSNHKYQLTDKTRIYNVLADSQYFEEFLGKYNKTVTGRFYHV